ncbi:ATP-binding protein [Pseudomonas sp. HR96]|uniref:ATP-binding protein n=1 Tax=Pseudomonas sp. HR96 TaxID=1027966 RepID=UPI002A75AE65|nr:ATP-binding protein [Pseudomonas sp. HR96]WPO98381.1 ATP-binding protein [Pseudomonas sp. HR96]
MKSSETAAFLAASENCAREPIHIPGSIQPHGLLLVLDVSASQILQASENAEAWLGVGAQALLGQALGDLIEDGGPLVERLLGMPEDDQNPYHVADVRFLNGAGRRAAMLAHRNDGVLIVEFEAVSERMSPYAQLYPVVRTFINQLQAAQSVDELCLLAVEEIKRLSGFGRVKSYRFDAQGNGRVNAELADPGYPRYLGLCFPADDIPQQARSLYCANRVRLIADAYYEPVPLLPATHDVTGAPLDLSFAALRSVSPVHLQYMRNMGTLASMSVSIVVAGRLWGLISCHHNEPRQLDVHARTACELVGNVLSLQIETRETHDNHQHLLRLRHKIVQLLSSMADRDSVNEGLKALPDVFIGFAQANGAAVVTGPHCELMGDTPPQSLVDALAQWLADRNVHDVFQSDNVGRDIPELPELTQHIGGVMAVAISELHSHYLFWFKPEQARTVDWAGRPEKTLADSGSLNPRASFERWAETVRGFSSPWHELEAEGARELRVAVLGIVLRKAEELAQLSNELKKSNKELEAFSYSVSHDLRAPLRHIAGYAELLADFESERLSERGLRFLEHIGDSAKFAGSLVDNLLSFSQMGRSALRFSDVDMSALVESIRREMLPDYEGRDITWELKPLPTVIADAAFVHLALRNLMSNAIKYTRNQPHAVIEVGAVEDPDAVVVYVRDNGVGFDMQYASKLFGVFQRLHRMEEFEGTGIGLASVRRIIERHDGKVWAHGELGKGATFYFALPRRNHSGTAGSTAGF